MDIIKSFRLLSSVSVLFLLAVLLTAPLAHAQQDPVPSPREPTAVEELGYGMASVLASVFYSPAKVTYAGLGLITGGLSYVLTGGNGDVANEIIYPAIKGNYVVTPRHLQGSEPIYFVGAPPPVEEPVAQSGNASPSTTQP